MKKQDDGEQDLPPGRNNLRQDPWVPGALVLPEAGA